jgi:Zn-dependent protease
MPRERKIYTSFHDIPPREYMYFPEGSLDAGRPGKFSRIEIIHLLISIGVLTIAFAFALSGNNLYEGATKGFILNNLIFFIPLSFLGILTAFFFHELAHKFMAQRHGLWSEFRMFPQGLYLALFLGILTPFVFAAPGAVMFRGGSRTYETGQIAMAGPLANIIIALITFPIYLYVFYGTQIGIIFGFICLINAWLAIFNLLPFGPLDGVKIIRWNATVWIIMLIVAISILMSIMQRNPLTF